jgi:hypothetical protein
MDQKRRRPCPFCTAPVRVEARSCPYCRRSILAHLRPSAPVSDARLRYQAAKKLLDLFGPSIAFGELIHRLGTTGVVLEGLTRAEAELAAEELGKLGIVAEFSADDPAGSSATASAVDAAARGVAASTAPANSRVRPRRSLLPWALASILLLALLGGFALHAVVPGCNQYVPFGSPARRTGIADPRDSGDTPSGPERMPTWLSSRLARMKLPHAEYTAELIETPEVLVDRNQVVFEGDVMAQTETILASGRLTRVDPLYDALKSARNRWEDVNPGGEFPGILTLWVDARVPALVVKSVAQTCAYAGFPTISFGVHQRSASTWGRINANMRVPGPPGSGDQAVSGRLPPEHVRGIVRAGYARMRSCYEAGLLRNPELEGRLSIRFVIGRSGRVREARIQETSLSDSAVTKCVLGVFSALEFMAPDPGEVTVVYPIHFAPSE